MIDFHHDPTKITYMQDKVIVHIYEPKSIRVAFGSSYTIKENVDPLTDKILEEKTFESDEDIEKAARDVFRVKVYHPVKFFRRGKWDIGSDGPNFLKLLVTLNEVVFQTLNMRIILILVFLFVPENHIKNHEFRFLLKNIMNFAC